MAEPSLFQDAGEELPLAVVVAVVADDDPFGPDTVARTPKTVEELLEIPDHSGMSGFLTHGDPETGKGDPKAKKPAQVDHSARTVKYWQKLGYQCDRVDGWMSVGGGRWQRKDLQGIWDFMITKPGELPGFVQVTSACDTAQRLRKMCGVEPAPDNKRPRVENLRHMLACGFRCLLQSFEQVGGRGSDWAPTVMRITEETIALVESRRRGPRKK